MHPRAEEFPEGTKTAVDAADAVGCDVAQIASSIAVEADGELAVIVTSGANQVDMAKVADLLGATSASMADAERIRRHSAGRSGASYRSAIRQTSQYCSTRRC